MEYGKINIPLLTLFIVLPLLRLLPPLYFVSTVVLSPFIIIFYYIVYMKIKNKISHKKGDS